MVEQRVLVTAHESEELVSAHVAENQRRQALRDGNVPLHRCRYGNLDTLAAFEPVRRDRTGQAGIARRADVASEQDADAREPEPRALDSEENVWDARDIRYGSNAAW